MKNSILHDDLGFKPFLPKGKIETLICWDQWYPEAARLTALKEPRFYFTLPLVWHPGRKSNMERINMVLG
jgi:N-carbamoylputrescine amidase